MSEIIQYYNQIASIYDEDRFGNSYGKYIDFQERQLLKSFLSTENGKILDLACGSGRLLDFADFGVDASSEMLKIAQEKFPKKKLFHSDAEKLPFGDEKINVVFSFHLFMHLEKEKTIEIFKEIHRILDKNGRFIFDIPSKHRRNIIGNNQKNWHGSFSFTKTELENEVSEFFEIQQYFGYLFFPIHRFPKKIRKHFIKLDQFLNKTFLKKYASYLVFEMKKR